MSTDIVDLKIANRSWLTGSIPADQIAELKGEIQRLRDQPLNLNIHGLQQTFVEQERKLSAMEADHETIKLENLRLMLHLKNEIQDKSTVTDGLLKLMELNNLNSDGVLDRLKQAQHGSNMRISEEIDALQRVIQGQALGQGGPTLASQVFNFSA